LLPGIKAPPAEAPVVKPPTIEPQPPLAPPVKPPVPAEPMPVQPEPAVKPAPAKPALDPVKPGLPDIWPHPVPGAPPPKLEAEPDVNPIDVLDPEADPEPDVGPGPGPEPQPDPKENACPPGTLPIAWPSPSAWSVDGIGDMGANSPSNNKPPQLITRRKPPVRRKTSIRDAYISNPINQAALKAAAKAKKGLKGQIHHKWPLFVDGPDRVDNLVFLETKPVNRHSAWHQELYRQPHGYLLWDPDQTRYCVL
jgi:hypothetical protein